LRADSIVENCIGIVSLPLGLATNFLVNNKKYSIPMALEEPSVIAAVSSTAKLIAENNGFFCYNDPPLMIGQIHFADVDEEYFAKIINENKQNLIKQANSFCQHMVQIGGGVKDISLRVLPKHESIKTKYISVDLVVNVMDSMGANTINTITEGLSNILEDLLDCKGKSVLKILSNLAIYRKATAEFKINIKNLNYKNLSGENLAKRIIQAYEISYLDPFRTSTHNKGIMNGIDAVAVALGQDWRAVEAAAHTWASIDHETFSTFDRYKPLTYYKIVEFNNEKYLYGSLTMPIAVGSVGGSINSNPNYSNMFKLMGNPNAQQLSCLMVSVGLAQNFAALRALVSEGIQKGHMGLHSKNVAIRAGVPDFLVTDVSNFMKNNNSINELTAKKYLEVRIIYYFYYYYYFHFYLILILILFFYSYFILIYSF
jgi:degradative hydroxymethylglutaryl-CoA reductase